MVCYIVPLIATFIVYAKRKMGKSGGVHGFWLNIMLLGAALFGGIDHLWNGELFLISANWMMDLALGVTITAAVFGSWGVIVYKENIENLFPKSHTLLGIFRK